MSRRLDRRPARDVRAAEAGEEESRYETGTTLDLRYDRSHRAAIRATDSYALAGERGGRLGSVRLKDHKEPLTFRLSVWIPMRPTGPMLDRVNHSERHRT
jgi:hypothetical protein